MLNKLIYNIANTRSIEISNKILPLFNSKNNCLDVGCGLGHLGFMIAKLTEQQITFLDIKKLPFTHPKVNVVIYNGISIPFPDSSFKTSMALFTLHHTKNPLNIVKEMKRITTDYIIIAEDLMLNRNQFISTTVKDIITNYFITKISFQYKTKSQWEELFLNQNLQIIDTIYFKSRSFLKLNHITWLLKK